LAASVLMWINEMPGGVVFTDRNDRSGYVIDGVDVDVEHIGPLS
jgi:hypothetical protein